MVSTGRCYACHTLRPISDFPYRRRDNAITASSKIRRYIGVLLQRPGAGKIDKTRSGGAIYRYRCIHPRAGQCPEVTHVERLRQPAQQVEVVQNERRRDPDFARHEVEVEEAIEAFVERNEFRREKADTQEKLRQCVGTTDRTVESQRVGC